MVRDTSQVVQGSPWQWIKRLQEDGNEILGQYILLRYRKGGSAVPQMAVIVSRKIGKACFRNRIKRQLKDIWRNQLSARLSAGYYLFIARRDILNASFREIHRDLLNIIDDIF